MVKPILFKLLAGTALAAIALPSAEAIAGEKGELRIGLNNWAENVAVSNMWKILLEEQGYSVELVMADKAVVYSGVAGDDLDMGLEVWMPTTDVQFMDRFEGDLTLQDSWYSGTGLGLVVPEYVEDVNSITDLPGHADRFEQGGAPTIVGIDPGSSLMGLTDEAMDIYGLDDFNLMAASDPAMTAALQRAARSQEPIVVTLWNPHWIFADIDLKYLDDPEGVFGQGEDIYWISRLELEEDHPEIVQWLNQWNMTDPQLSALMASINDLEDEERGAQAWIDENRDLVGQWLDGAS